MKKFAHGQDVRTTRASLPGAYRLLDRAPVGAAPGVGAKWWLQDLATGEIGHELAASERDLVPA